MTTALALLGALFGVGVSLAVAGLLPARPSLDAELARLDPYSVGGAASPAGGALTRLGQPLAGLVAGFAGGQRQVEHDRALVGRSEAAHAAAVGTGALVGAAAPPALVAIAALVGIRLPVAVPLVACLASALVGAMAPAWGLRQRAQAARAQFRQALASWLELVALAQAAGMGLESALQAASGVCEDPSFRRIGNAVDVSRATGVPPWDALTRLGAELAIPDLEELGANLALAGAEGARIRASLTSKSASLRRRELAEAEARANSTTERLFFPAVLLMLGFTVFVGYPALVTVTHVL